MDDDDKRKQLQSPSRKVSVWRTANITVPIIPENTYQLGPPRKMKPGRAQPLLQKLLTEMMENELTLESDLRLFAKNVAQTLRSRMVALSYRRYKIVVHVTIGRKEPDPGVFAASRCAWNADYDNFASSTFEDSRFFGTAVAYFLNFE